MHHREQDYAAWASEQAALLRQGEIQNLDFEHLAEELESIMGNERHQLHRRFHVLIAHLLKWQFQPENRSKSWRITIRNQRDDLEELLKASPSLRREVPEKIAGAYRKAVELAADETGLPDDNFPNRCPYDPEDILSDAFWPE